MDGATAIKARDQGELGFCHRSWFVVLFTTRVLAQEGTGGAAGWNSVT